MDNYEVEVFKKQRILETYFGTNWANLWTIEITNKKYKGIYFD